MILTEMVHDARIVRMNGTHPPAGMRKWFGDSIGRWEGDTLVIETTNFHPMHGFRNSWENLKVTERLSRQDARHAELPLHRRGSDDVYGAVYRRAGVQRDGAGRDGLRVRVPRGQLRPRRRDERRARAGARGREEEVAAVGDDVEATCAHSRGPDRPREGVPQSRSHAGGGECPRRSPPPAYQDPQEPASSRAGRSSAAPSGSAARSLARPRCSPMPGIADIRLPYPLNPSNADRVIALLDRTHLSFIVDHPVVAKQWSDAMTRAGKQVDVLVKVDVGFHRCGIDPAAAGSVDDDSRASRRCRACDSRACCRMPGHAYHAHSEDELQADGGGRSADDERPRRSVPQGRHHDRGDQRRRHAAGAILDSAEGLHRVSARQLRLLRSHAGRARRRDAR